MTESNSSNNSTTNNNFNTGRGRRRFKKRGSRNGGWGIGISINNNNNNRRPTITPISNFTIECPELKGYIIDINTSEGKFDKAWKNIKEYVGKEYTEGGDIRCCLESKSKIQIPKSEPLS